MSNEEHFVDCHHQQHTIIRSDETREVYFFILILITIHERLFFLSYFFIGDLLELCYNDKRHWIVKRFFPPHISFDNFSEAPLLVVLYLMKECC